MTSVLADLLPALAAAWASPFTSRGLPAPVAAELVAQGDGTVPAVPTAPGQHRPLALDAAGGCAYVRRSGEITLARPDSSTCDRRRLRVTVPVRVVVVADLEGWNCRTQEVALALADHLLGALETGGLPVTALGLSGAKLTPERLLTDSVAIFTDELGYAVPLPARRGLVAVEAELEVVLDPACLPTCPPSDPPR